MLRVNDELERDILVVLLNVSKNRLQRKEIRDQLKPKYVPNFYGKGSFDVVLQRKLDRLCISRLLDKEYDARASFYYIPNKAKDKIKFLLEKQEIKKKIDQMTPQEIQEFIKFIDFLAKSGEGEEFWIWLPDIDHPEKIKKFKNVGTKILRQD